MIPMDLTAPKAQSSVFRHEQQFTALILPTECDSLSSAVLNGGFARVRSLLNLRVDANQPPPWPPATQTLSEQAAQLQLPLPCTGMMTAASMQSLGYYHSGDAEFQAECWVTSGLANLRRPADRADNSSSPGTINIWLLVHHALTPTAMAEALIQLTEAKVTAVRDLNLLSPVSNLPASGTGTDSHAVVCLPTAQVLEFCGKHTKAGEHIGHAVYQACLQSLQKCIAVLEQTD